MDTAIRDVHEGDLTFSTQPAEAGLELALEQQPGAIIDLVDQSGLKGCGGAGFPTARKWRLAAEQAADRRYVVCNADESEPGAFKDRVILERYPDLVLDGMTIAAWAIGATSGVIYLRGEYAFLRPALDDCIARRRSTGTLGLDVLGRDGFDFDVIIHLGAGAYVCGEESALLESLEGRRGHPRNRPPYPVRSGLHGKPTVVNNVETLAWVPCIISNGAGWFRSLGTAQSPGLKLFSISGDVDRPGVYELPMGTTIAALLDRVGGAGAKAVQVGGAAGICVPAEQFDRALTFEDVTASGAVIVFGPDRDMLQVAENFLEFFVAESCGQCTPCRIGNQRLLEGIRDIRRGQCSTDRLSGLLDLCETMRATSKCGLGQTSPNAFQSIIAAFPGDVVGRSAKSLTWVQEVRS